MSNPKILPQQVQHRNETPSTILQIGALEIGKCLFVLLSVLILAMNCARAFAAADLSSDPQIHPFTLAIFSDRPIPDELWQSLQTELRGELASNSDDVEALFGPNPGKILQEGGDAEIRILRGESIHPGIVVDNLITVYLHEDCRTALAPHAGFFVPAMPHGPLGWVFESKGDIQPFLHIDCARIGQVLSTQAIGRNAHERNQLLALAISRVILHEWIHVATQNPGHSTHGLTKATFGVQDLIARTPEPSAVHASGR